MTTDYEALMTALVGKRVDFVVIGAVALVLHGSARVTRDLDICYSRERANLRALAAALKPFAPTLRGAPDTLPFTVLVWIVVSPSPSRKMPPPPKVVPVTRLLLIVLPVTVRAEFPTSTPPPPKKALLPEMVLFVTVRATANAVIPPPRMSLWLFVTWEPPNTPAKKPPSSSASSAR